MSQIDEGEEVVFPLGQEPEAAEDRPEVEGEEAEEEAEVPRKAREPSEPTGEERRRHETTHLPFRSWCPYCVRVGWPTRRIGTWAPPDSWGSPKL